METRFNGNVVPFASNSTAGERTVFGDWTTESDDIDNNLNADFINGWEAGLEGTLNPYPPSQYFNAAVYTATKLTSYLYQQGIAEWNTLQEYKQNCFVTGSNGDIYRAKTGTVGTPNIGNNPTTDSVNWESLNDLFNPSGIITMWSGSIATIPNGYFLCDGNNGTPDLRGRFIYGASGESEIRATGGSADAVNVSHSHTGSTNTTGSHYHTVPKGEGYTGGINNRFGNSSPTQYTTRNTGSAGSHSHTVTIDNAGESGVGKNLPPYMKLAYIQKA